MDGGTVILENCSTLKIRVEGEEGWAWLSCLSYFTLQRLYYSYIAARYLLIRKSY